MRISFLPKWELSLLALSLSTAGLQAQTFNSVSLYDLLLASGATSPATKTTAFSGQIPDTDINIQVTTTQGVFAGQVVGDSLGIVWAATAVDPTSTALTNDWTITLTGGTARDVRFNLIDFDHLSTPTTLLERLTNLGPELGAPSYLQTTGAIGDAQMTYTAALGGQISHPVDLGSSTAAGDAVADWYGVNMTSLSFTVERSSANLGNGFNLSIGEIPPVPEPSAATLAVLCGTLMLGRRRRS